MAKTFSQIIDQINRLNKEASAIQSGVIERIKKEIAAHGLTVEHLFGAAKVTGSTTPRSTGKRTAKRAAGAPKFADGNGNTWGGMGKRPGWIREALEAGKDLSEFLAGGKGKATKTVPAAKPKKAAAALKKPAGKAVVKAVRKKAAAPAVVPAAKPKLAKKKVVVKRSNSKAAPKAAAPQAAQGTSQQ